jgi:NAD(P)-dependent dehydrogenase (short-subunit alcohol dehydrogenase family)
MKMTAGSPTEGKIAIVTGGSQGIGFACARELAARDMQVVILARSEDVLKRAAAEIGDGCSFVPTDVSDPEAARKVINDVAQRLGSVDVLVNSHGIFPAEGEFPDISDQVWDEVLSINLRGVINTAQAAARVMRTQRSGVIVNVSSISAELSEPLAGPYCVAKGALGAMTRAAAYDMGKHNVRVVGVQPGWVRTPMTEEYVAPLSGQWLESSMLGRVGEPDEIAKVVAFLASPEASYITGTMVTVDGGHSGILPHFRAGEPIAAAAQ